MPDDWRDSIIVPIFKQKGDASECSNYRGIKLISHTMKVYEGLFDSRLREMVPIYRRNENLFLWTWEAPTTGYPELYSGKPFEGEADDITLVANNQEELEEKGDEMRLSVMEMKMLRWTAGVTRMNSIRNDAIRRKFGVAPIARCAKLACDGTATFCVGKNTASAR
ncbi:unnamed protein product [Heligmosomoides polygyrus]|uniref:Retrotransposon protein n=1 Tax=Heligmosomoides polygyrus TaxID=6339 RepID=A0A183G2W2_HELPZ|nr:unnamed protein product [Heligmosomoides polygyrus]